MNFVVILVLFFILPIVGLLVWFILSSCLGDNVRASIVGTSANPRRAAYGRSYARGMGFGIGHAGSEQIEMEDVMGRTWDERDSDDDER